LNRLAERVVLDGSTIKATSFTGKVTEIELGEVAEMDRFTTRSLAGRMRLLRIRDERGQRILVSDQLDGFHDLYAVVRQLAPTAEISGPTTLDKIIYGAVES